MKFHIVNFLKSLFKNKNCDNCVYKYLTGIKNTKCLKCKYKKYINRYADRGVCFYDPSTDFYYYN